MEFKTTWTNHDESDFFAKLNRARKDNRPQYLRIQAYVLIQTKNIDLLNAAELLLNRFLNDFPENKFDRSSVFNHLGEIYKLRRDFEKALEYFKKSIDFELVYDKVNTESYLNYAEIIVMTGKTSQYEYVKDILLKKPTDVFRYVNYKVFSLLSIIERYMGNFEEAEKYMDLAERNANAETSGMRYHKYVGVVDDRIEWLDNMVAGK